MNRSVYKLGNVLPPTTKLTAVWSPMCYLLWEPDENTLGPGNPGAFESNDSSDFPSSPPTGGEGIGPLHDKNGNILALDGHVDFMATNQFRTLSRIIALVLTVEDCFGGLLGKPTAAADRPHFIAARSEGAFGPFVLVS